MQAGQNTAGNIPFTKNLDQNVDILSRYFKDNDTLIKRPIESRDEPYTKYCLLYLDGMVDNHLVNEDVIRPLLYFKVPKDATNTIDVIVTKATFSNSVEKTTEENKILTSIIYGDCILVIDGCNEVLILNTKGWSTRSIEEPESERVLKGPREGFTEAIMPNLSMLRRKLKTPHLKIKFKEFGLKSKTKACICYIDNVVNKDVLKEFETRLEKINIDGILDTNYIVEIIRDSPYSPVKTIGNTERPDVVAAKLLEGRVALFLDGTPVVLTAPSLFIEHFQSDEDYYVNYYFSSFGRILRYISFFITTSIPAIYLALTTFHQEMLPTPLLMSISMARQDVPFPTFLELLLMLIVFELLRESGARMPGLFGQALSIVGALVIGQAAVQAKIVSAPIIIIVALAGITGLMVPRIKGLMIFLRFGLMLCSMILGLYGYLFGILAVLTHLFSLKSFGIPIMTSSYTKTWQDKKDIIIRAPWWYMLHRPKLLSRNQVRQESSDPNIE